MTVTLGNLLNLCVFFVKQTPIPNRVIVVIKQDTPCKVLTRFMHTEHAINVSYK